MSGIESGTVPAISTETYETDSFRAQDSMVILGDRTLCEKSSCYPRNTWPMEIIDVTARERERETMDYDEENAEEEKEDRGSSNGSGSSSGSGSGSNSNNSSCNNNNNNPTNVNTTEASNRLLYGQLFAESSGLEFMY